MIGIVRDGYFQIAQNLYDTLRLETRDLDDGLCAAFQGSTDSIGDDVLALDELKQLVARPHARGATCGKDDGGDLWSCHHRPRSAFPRCTAVTSAMIESAISAAP